MHRRNFSTGLIAAGLAAPVILTGNKSFATSGDEDGRFGSETIKQFSRVLLIVGVSRVIISYMLIVNPLGLLGIDLRSPVPQFDENRLSTGNLPILGNLFRQPLKDRFNPTVLIGQVFLIQSLLMIVPQRGPVSKVSRVVIAHRNLSWEPKPKPRRMRMSKIPSLGELHRNGTLLGSAYQTDRELLVLLKPSIVKLGS
ncbi:hypothetical protein [Profundibacter sp.]